MKTRTFRTSQFASFGATLLVTFNAAAQSSALAPSPNPASAPVDVATVKLPYGVEDVLKLSRAQVSEDVTLNYIRNSGTIYQLAPKDIVYLRNEGVSDRVINTMLDQRKNVPADIAAQTAAPSAPAVPLAPASSDASAVAVAQYAPTYVQPSPVYVQPEPTYTPASTLYIIPYPYAGYRYPGSYYSYYGRYYGCLGPSVGFGFGYSGSGRCGPYYGGHHRGYYPGGHYGYYGRR